MLVEDLPDDISFKSKRGFSLNTLKIEALERLNTSITINPVKDKKNKLNPSKGLEKDPVKMEENRDTDSEGLPDPSNLAYNRTYWRERAIQKNKKLKVNHLIA